MLKVRPGFENQVRRGVEEAGQDQFQGGGEPYPSLALRLASSTSNWSKDPFQPPVIPVRALAKVSISGAEEPSAGTQVRVTRVWPGPSGVNCTVVNMDSGQVGDRGWRTVLPFSSLNCWI